MDRVAVMLEEYKSLRVETMESAKLMQQALSLGLVANGAILGAMATLLAKGGLSNRVFLPVFFVMIPLVSFGIMSFWAGELRRLVRAGVFNAELSEEINRQILRDDPCASRALTWEIWLHSQVASPQMVMSYLCSLGVFVVLALISAYLGSTITDHTPVIFFDTTLPFDVSSLWTHCFYVVTFGALGWIGLQGATIKGLGAQAKRALIRKTISRKPNL